MELRVGDVYYIHSGDVRFDAVGSLTDIVKEDRGLRRELLLFRTQKGTAAFLLSTRQPIPWCAMIVSGTRKEGLPLGREGPLLLPAPTQASSSGVLRALEDVILWDSAQSPPGVKPYGGASVVGEVVRPSASGRITARGIVSLQLDCGFTFAAAPLTCGEFLDRSVGGVTMIELRSVSESDDPRRLFSPDRFDNPLTPGEFKEWDDACRFILVRRSGERLWDSWWGPSAAGVLVDRVDSVVDMEDALKRFAYMGRCRILGEIKFADPRFAWT